MFTPVIAGTSLYMHVLVVSRTYLSTWDSKFEHHFLLQDRFERVNADSNLRQVGT